MGKCKDCKWWEKCDRFGWLGWCSFGKICEEILTPMNRFLVAEDFGCIHFERR